ncbi:MAG TPA: DUF6805 domain-containing protein, partial [Terriglobales bacterium]|nr:DUF6805 domain-containing protein [Terriglobales bacterium]
AFHAYGIYSESPKKLWVSMYAPTTVDWSTEGVKLEMDTDLPIGENATLKIVSGKAQKFTIALLRPYWAGDGFALKVNGKPLSNVAKADSYIEIARKWKPGDTVQIVLPKTLRKEPLPDNPTRTAIMWGPLVLASDLGSGVYPPASEENRDTPPASAPVVVTAEQHLDGWLKPVAGQPGTFRTVEAGPASGIEFKPFYELARRRYAIYWDVFTPSEWKTKSEAYAAEEERKRRLTAATVAFAQPGQMQTERDFAEQGEDSEPVQLQGHYGRRANSWFSFELPVDPSHPVSLVVTYSNDARARRGDFDVLAEGTKIGEQTIERRTPENDIRFFDVEYKLPSELVSGTKKVTVRFQAKEGAAVPGVFGIRSIRGDMLQ